MKNDEKCSFMLPLFQMSRDKRIQMLCELNKNHEPKMVGTSGLQFGEQDHVDLLLQHRKHTTDLCCQQHGISNIRECFSDVRRRRIDQFCATGETAVPSTKPQQKWVSQKQSDCCLDIGEYRYECFDARAGSQEMLKDDQGLRQGGYSLDAFDPVNDLDDFEDAPLKIPKSSSSKEGQTATKVSNTASQFLVDGHAGRYLEKDESSLNDSALPLAIEGIESSDVDNSNEEEHVSRADGKMKGQSRHRSKKNESGDYIRYT
ncbi:uncharacterized protein LOC127852472 [Dreissena polymorpha]|uniref:uncharacterized protein LOC127852472 n=1 Tax=Dreissena polymorpha TaxID=45954 RepID=UPI002263AE7B|nr:uncharacterized protein LOC127852472 [Dreissena polymorpha]